MSNKDKKNNELVVQTGSPIIDAVQKINSKLAELKHIQDSVYKTGTKGTLRGFTNAVQDETSVEELIKMHSSVNGREKAYNESAGILGIGTYGTFKAEGYTKEDWEADIKLRIAIIQNQDQLNKLKGLKKDFEELLDKEDKLLLLNERLKTI